jgi:hypothetical protein
MERSIPRGGARAMERGYTLGRSGVFVGFNFFFFFFFLIIVHYILLVSMRDISEGASLGSEKIPRACQEGSLLREGCAVDMWAQQEARCV